MAQDRRVLSLVICMVSLALAVLFSGEVRVLLRANDYWTPVLLVAAFLVACLIVRRILIDRAVYHPEVILNGKRHGVQLEPAHPLVQRYVAERASELGLNVEIETSYVPGSWRAVDAYVFGQGLHQSLVVTGGLQTLYLRRRPGEMERFQFIVDHELGHIAAEDTSLLYLARAVLVVSPLFLVVKICLIYVIGRDLILRAYTDVFPAVLETSYLWLTDVPLPKSVPEWFVWSFFLVFTVGAAALLFNLYVALVRRREFLADRFAVVNSTDHAKAVEAMKELLYGAPLPQAPPHAFLGGMKWHPHPVDRVQQIYVSVTGPIPERLGAITVILTLIAIRFLLGISTDPREDSWDVKVLVPASAAFVLLIGLVLDSFLPPPTAASKGDRVKNQFIELTRLIAWSLSAAALLWFPSQFFNNPQINRFSSQVGFQYLIDVESVERTLLYFSLPVVVAVFGIVSIAVSQFASSHPLNSPFFRVLGVSAAAVLILWAASVVVGRPLRAYRASKYAEYWSSRVQSIQEGRANTDVFHNLLADHPSLATSSNYPITFDDPKMEEIGSEPGTNEQKYNSYRRLLPMELKLVHSRLAHEFSPPLAFVTLWQGPIRVSLL